ncbi:MAG: glycosyltransferase family 39 protein [bacterium]|nr:glycosyltransferase family 39 protein [bacterium]
MRSRITQRAAKRTRPTPAPENVRRFHYVVPLLLVILACGLGLRLAGLSHGLSEGEIYHPDTPHLMAATRHFLEGTYFFRINNPDCDGYPYFYSHIVEYLWRGIHGIKSFFGRLILGSEYRGEPAPALEFKSNLFWLARITNAVLSTLVIFIVYRIAVRTLDRPTGLLAAGLVAVSPMNISMAHFATNDTAVFFFVTLTVLVAVRMYSAGTWLNYLLGGVLVACSFSAKYHGAIVGLTCLLAHVLRNWPPRRLFSRDAISRLAVMGAAFFIAVLVANPGFIISPEKAFHDFRQYVRYIPGARLTESQTHMGLFGRAWLSCKLNAPVLLRSLGWVAAVIGFAGLLRAFFRGKRLVIVASFPACYLLFTFFTKPVQQRFYLGAMFPTLLLLGAALLVEASRMKKIRTATTVAAVAVSCTAFFYLAKTSLTEVFFFSNTDTRRWAGEWVRENIPSSYRMKPGPYTALLNPSKAPADFVGTVFLSSSIRPAPTPEDVFLLKAFDLEKDALPLFRNPRVEIYPEETPLLGRNFTLPVYQRIPSKIRSDFIFVEGATFYQDEQFIELQGRDIAPSVSKFLVSSKPLTSAIVVVRNGCLPGSVRLRLGGVSRTFFLGPSAVRWEEFRGLRTCFPSRPSHHFYKLRVSATSPHCLVEIALTDEEKGVALYNLGEYGAAHRYLVDAARETGSPLLAAMAYISGKLSATVISPEDEKFLLDKASLFEGELNPDSVFSGFRISPDYLDALPYLSLKPHDVLAGFEPVVDISASQDFSLASTETTPPQAGLPGTWRISTPPLILEPGCYTASVRVRCPPRGGAEEATVKVSLAERDAKVVLAERQFSAADIGKDYTELLFPFEKPAEVAECRILITFSQYLPLSFDRIDVRPAPLESLRAVQRRLRILGAPPDSLPEARLGALDYRALLHLGRQRLDQRQDGAALSYYLLAHRLRPELAEPVRRIQSIAARLTPEDAKLAEEALARAAEQKAAVEMHEVSASFKNDVRLTGYAVSRGPFRPGDSVGMTFYWDAPKTRVQPKGLIVWVHLLDPNGKKMLQLDHYLTEDLSFPQEPERIAPVLSQKARIPDDAAPGQYRIEVGIWDPLRDWRPAVTSTTLPHARYSVTVGEIVVESR